MIVSTSDISPLVHRLVEMHLNGKPLPAVITVSADGAQLPLGSWLARLRFNREPFSDHLASKLGLMVFPPVLGEAAITLRNQLAVE